jgi:hypothetical protein
MRTSAFTLLTLALSLCAASQAQAEAARSNSHNGQISDSDLFEVHLHKPASGHKRLPSEILRDHNERDGLPDEEDQEEEEIMPTAAPASVTAALTYGPTSTVLASSSAYTTPAVAQITFSPRQPSHFIKHRRQKHGKRRLSEAQRALQVVDADESSVSSAEEAVEDSQAVRSSTRTIKGWFPVNPSCDYADVLHS